MKKPIFKRVATVLIPALFTFTSCNTVSDDLSQLSSVVERTDMVITGALHFVDFRQSPEDDSSEDLVTYNYYGNPSENIDFILNLSDGNRLVIQVYDAERLNPWQQTGQPYNIYPQSDLEDKLSYAKVALVSPAGEPLYATHSGPNTPPGITLDAFRINVSDGQLIHCRMRDMILYHGTDADRTIAINGTFVGALTFE